MHYFPHLLTARAQNSRSLPWLSLAHAHSLPPPLQPHALSRCLLRKRGFSLPEAEVRRLQAVPGKMAAAGPAPGPADELVSSVTLYRRRPRLLHGTVLPFVAGLYPAWLWLWGPRVWAAWGEAAAAEEEAQGPGPAPPEAALLALAAIGVLHLLTALSGLWSVHAHCALTCVRVSWEGRGGEGKAVMLRAWRSPRTGVGRCEGEAGGALWVLPTQPCCDSAV